MNLHPPSTLIIGSAGSGKSSSIATQLLKGMTSFVIVTEPDGVASILDSCARLKAPIDKLHWVECLPTAQDFRGLEDMITKISTLDQKGLADTKDMGKASFRDAAMKFLRAHENFKCERTGQFMGRFTDWDDNCFLNWDSLTGVSSIAWGCTVGYKPTANPGEWGIAQNFVYSFLMKVQNDRRCFFAMTSHPEKEMDEMSGIKKIMVSTIGAKLAPKIPVFFSEVVQAKRVPDPDGKGARYYWSNTELGIELKSRSLPISNQLAPDFGPIIEAYRARKKLAASTPAEPPSAPEPPTATRVLPNAPMSPGSVLKQ